MAAFAGSDVAHGQTQIGNTRRNGKTEAKSFVVREPITEDLVAQHLKGETGVGQIPIRSDNKCKFGAIDIDTYPMDHRALADKIQEHNIPVVLCRSKSGGAHLFLFLDDWYLAVDVREYLIEIAAAIGYSGCEIFPKQDQILVERGDVGNFINLPYFAADQTTRYAINGTSDALDLEYFLDLVDKKTVSLVI